MKYCEMSVKELNNEKNDLLNRFKTLTENGLNLSMSRGVPSSQQLDNTQELLSDTCYFDANGLDCRNYGCLTGIPELKVIFAKLMGLSTENIIIGGNSSLSLMHDTLVRFMLFGVPGNHQPWSQQGKIKFLCPVPGYDRHFSITELLGIEMINIPMDENGPDMDMVEKLVAEDESIKGIWCVPKYSNPSGVTYSDEVVKRFANLNAKADDFIIMWDNAYAVHDLYDEGDSLLNIMDEAEKVGKQDRIFIYASTSKITMAGAGVAMIGASDRNIKAITKLMSIQTIGSDKMNQLRHARFLKNPENVKLIMKKHAEILRPKFEMVLKKLDSELTQKGIASWSTPKGGYFINLVVENGCADKVVKMASDAGVKLTAPAGSAFPYKKDPQDCNIRLAPSFPVIEELEMAIDIVCICVKIVSIEKLLYNK